jgi:DNA repair ATPase RecN
MSDLTPAEQAFFETGELPPELQPQDPEPVPVSEEVKISAPPGEIPSAPVDQTEYLRTSLAEEQRRYAEAKAQLDALQAQLKAKLEPETPAPNADDDPLGAMLHQLNQVNTNVAELQQKLTQEQQNNLMRQQLEQFTQSVRTVKEQFEKVTPDFNDAYNHIRTVRTEDLRMLGIAESEIPKVLLQDEFNIAQSALQRGKNPAEELYNMAKRYGYAAKFVPQAQQTPDQKLANINRGQQAARQPQRSAPESELTIDGLKDAGDADLTKMVQNDDLWAKLVGGKSNDIF